MDQQAVSKECYFQVQRNCSYATMCNLVYLCHIDVKHSLSYLGGSNFKQEGLVSLR